MKKFTKRLGLFMLVLVLGLCSITFVGCFDDSDDENDAMLAGGFTRVSCDAGVSVMRQAAQEDDVDEFVRLCAVLASATEKDYTVNIHNFASYSASYDVYAEDSKNGKKYRSSFIIVDEVFSNKNGAVQYSINFDDGTETEYFYEKNNNYYWAEESEGEISKRQWDKTSYETEIANYSFLTSSVLSVAEADELTFDVSDCAKKDSVYRLKLTTKTIGENGDTEKREIIFDFNTATKKIVKLSSTIIATYTDGDGDSNEFIQIVECTEFKYADVSLTIPQEILDAQVTA